MPKVRARGCRETLGRSTVGRHLPVLRGGQPASGVLVRGSAEVQLVVVAPGEKEKKTPHFLSARWFAYRSPDGTLVGLILQLMFISFYLHAQFPK